VTEARPRPGPVRALGRALLLAAHLAPGALGCATSSQGDAAEQLQRSVEAYNEAYRWKNYERASSFLPPDLRAAFVAAHEDDEKSLHVEDYQILAVDHPREGAADIRVRVTYILLPSNTVEKRTVVQHWQRVGGAWVLETEDNSIRALDPKGASQGRDAFGGAAAPGGAPVDVEVTEPGGTLRTSEDVSPESDAPAAGLDEDQGG
jgi:hypothetical protein